MNIERKIYDVSRYREDFPILGQTVHKHPLVYLDNAATTQKPMSVLKAMESEYLTVNANVHRGVHHLSQEATRLHELSRERVARYINSPDSASVIFTRGTTESINLVASCFSQAFMKAGDEVIVTQMDHHSNIVPWQLAASRCGILVKAAPVSDSGELLLDEFEKLFTPHTRLVSFPWVSNVMGTVNPVEQVIQMAHAHGVPVLLDAAQAAGHMRIDVQKLDVDFLAFSGHKVYGPTGIGVLYGKKDLLNAMPPYQGGGEMIQHVSFAGTTFNELPFKFEAGTPDFIATTGLAAALDYVEGIGLEEIGLHEKELLDYCLQGMAEIPDLRLIGQPSERSGVISFLVGDIHHFDMGTLLDHLGIEVRTGHHCAQPLMQRMGIEGTVRASFALYNTKEEVDLLIKGIQRVRLMFQ